ncbi:MAG: hypothetical protein HY904_01420 [Deltaproteobacteria bacterium]|nr:hypothetical protein [Deltaproteobacteria bacterium]
MATTARYWILAEDVAGARMIEQWLKSRSVDMREIKTIIAPKGQGSGKQWVTANVADHLRAFRAKKASHLIKGFIAMTDADELSVQQRRQQLEDALVTRRVAPRPPNAPEAFIIPKWEHETWARHINHQTQELEAGPVRWERQRALDEAVAAGGRLHTHRQDAPGCCPPSLQAADAELRRI